MPKLRKKSGYTRKDLREVSDNPQLMKADLAEARPFTEAFLVRSGVILHLQEHLLHV